MESERFIVSCDALPLFFSLSNQSRYQEITLPAALIIEHDSGTYLKVLSLLYFAFSQVSFFP